MQQPKNYRQKRVLTEEKKRAEAPAFLMNMLSSVHVECNVGGRRLVRELGELVDEETVIGLYWCALKCPVRLLTPHCPCSSGAYTPLALFAYNLLFFYYCIHADRRARSLPRSL